MNGSIVDYKTTLQPTVSLSSCEAELIALVDTAKRTKYIRSILQGLDIALRGPTKIYCDNTGAKQVAQATGVTKRTRHVDIKFFAIQRWQRDSEIEVRACRTTTNASDLMTKGLQKLLHNRHMLRLMGYHGPERHDDRESVKLRLEDGTYCQLGECSLRSNEQGGILAD